MKKYTLELDAFEIGCIAGMLLARNERTPRDGVLIHLSHRLAELAEQLYADSRAADEAADNASKPGNA